MPKRCVALFFVLLLVFCACGKTGTDEPDTTAAATEPTVTKPAVPVEFSLPELPDIGSYQLKKAPEPFFDAPLKDFKESADYGEIIPYSVTSDSRISAYGFMTVGGKIITAPIYSIVYEIVSGERRVYAAEYKTEYFTPGQKPVPKPENDEIDWEAEREREKAVITRYQLITGDGSNQLTLPDNVEPIVPNGKKNNEGKTWIECRRYDEDYTQELFFYDFDLLPLGDLERCHTKENCYVNVLARTADGLMIAENTNAYSNDAEETRILTYKNGKVQKEVEFDDCITAVAGNLLIGDHYIYTVDGKRVFRLSEDVSCLAHVLPDCVFLSDLTEKKLIKIKNGKTEKTTALPDTGTFTVEELYLGYGRIGDDPCLFTEVCYGEQKRYYIYDTDLRLLHTFDGDGSGTDIIRDEITDDICAVRQMKNGEAAVFRLNGKLIARIPYDEENDWLTMYDDCLLCSGENGRISLFFAGKNEKKEYDFSVPGKQSSFCDVNPRFIVCMYRMPLKGGMEDYEWRRNESWYRIFDTKTGALIYDNVTEFHWLAPVYEKYCSFSRSGCTYVCDNQLNVIAVLPDGYFA